MLSRLGSGPKDPNPRQGTETHDGTCQSNDLNPVRKTLIPARGRKLTWSSTARVSCSGPKDPNPRQGTETDYSPRLGNGRFRSPKDPNPRQGTETDSRLDDVEAQL